MDLEALATARENARAAGVSVEWRPRRACGTSSRPAGPGVVVTNPPYGARLEVPDELYRGHGAGVRADAAGGASRCSRGRRRSSARCAGAPDRALTVFNGDIECRLLVYDVE